MSDTETAALPKHAAKKTAGKKAKVKKAARKAVAKSPSKIARAEGSTVYTFQPRNARPANPVETFMTQKKQYDKLAQDATLAQKDQMEALVKSSNIALKGMEDIFKICMQLAQSTAEKNAQAFKSLVGCKTLNEFTEAHTRVTQTNFDDFMSGATRLSELTVKLATDAFEPINEQFSRTLKFANDALAA